MTDRGEFVCPHCGRGNSDNWPLDVKGEIVDGGCQDCWESECDKSWWIMARALDTCFPADASTGG